MKVEIGGGPRPRGEGFVNVDCTPGPLVDVVADAHGLPFDDGSVTELYSSHALEHCVHPVAVLWEIARVCAVGAPVEIRVPHEFSPMALCPGHRCVISELQIRHWCEEFVELSWGKRPKRLRLLRVERIPSAAFADARVMLCRNGFEASDDELMRFIPGACHETRFFLEVIANEGAT